MIVGSAAADVGGDGGDPAVVVDAQGVRGSAHAATF